MPDYDKLTIVSCISGLGLGAYFIFEPRRIFILPVAAVVAVLAWLIIKDHPGLSAEDRRLPFLFVPLSPLLVIAAALMLEPIVGGVWMVVAAILAGGLVAGTLIAEWLTVGAARYSEQARLAVNFVAYLVAFSLFETADNFGLDGFASLLAAGVVSFLLSTELLRDALSESRRVLLYSGVVAVILMQVRWALGFWPLERTLGAIALVLGFYIATGVVHSHFSRQLNRSAIAEYAAVTLVGVAILFGVRLWAG